MAACRWIALGAPGFSFSRPAPLTQPSPCAPGRGLDGAITATGLARSNHPSPRGRGTEGEGAPRSVRNPNLRAHPPGDPHPTLSLRGQGEGLMAPSQLQGSPDPILPLPVGEGPRVRAPQGQFATQNLRSAARRPSPNPLPARPGRGLDGAITATGLARSNPPSPRGRGTEGEGAPRSVCNSELRSAARRPSPNPLPARPGRGLDGAITATGLARSNHPSPLGEGPRVRAPQGQFAIQSLRSAARRPSPNPLPARPGRGLDGAITATGLARSNPPSPCGRGTEGEGTQADNRTPQPSFIRRSAPHPTLSRGERAFGSQPLPSAHRKTRIARNVSHRDGSPTPSSTSNQA